MIKNLYGVAGGIGCGKDEVTNFIIDALEKETSVTYDNVKYATELKKLLALILDVSVEMLEDREFKEKVIPDMEITELIYYYSGGKSGKTPHKTVRVFSKFITKETPKDYCPENYEYLGSRTIEVSPRWLMQNIANNCFRDIISKDFWVYKTFKNFTNDSRWVISDLRFPKNEGNAITANDGVKIGVRRKFGLRFPKFKDFELNDDPYAIPEILMKLDPKLYESLTNESEISTLDLKWCDYIIDNNGTLNELKEKVRSIVCGEK